MLQFLSFAEDCNISHFITTRHGGVSKGNFSSFNPCLYTADKLESVIENRKRLANVLDLPVNCLITAQQVHGDRVIVLDKDFIHLNEKERKLFLNGSDAWITNVPNLCLTVQTADCVPLLMYDPKCKVVAAVHAGWRGTAKRIVEKCLIRMNEVFGCQPLDILIGIGPSIGQEAFEVGDEVVDVFAAINTPMEQVMYRDPSTGKAHLDLWKINQFQLKSMGLIDEHIEIAGICTYKEYLDFFSARRLGIQSGRICSGIYLKG